MPFALFSTPLGICGVAWSEQGITALQLPHASESVTRERTHERAGADEVEAKPPAWVREATKRIARHFGGDFDDLSDVKLDMRGVSPFFARVYEEARTVKAGATIGYADLALRAGSSKGASRAVGQAMAKNPFPIVVPCHRVLAAGNKAGGFSAYGGAETKRRMLTIEGVTLPASSSLTLFSGAAQTAFDAKEAVHALRASDKALARVIDQVGPLGLRVRELHTPFQALAQSIVYQQLTGKAAATILGRVHAIYGGPRGFRAQAILETKDEPLRSAGLSRAKTAALRDLATKTLDGTVPTLRAMRALEDDALVERLTAIRGIGRWTVEMLLIFRLGRPDVLPVDDYGVRKGLMRMLRAKELPTRKELAERGERWRPYRSAASWYLWRACELPE